MGAGYRIRCRSCIYSSEFLLGIGGDPSPFYDHEFTILHPKTRKQVKSVIGHEPIHNIDYEYQLISCEKCHILYSRPIMEIKYGDGQVFTTNKNCSQCKGQGKVIKNLEDNINQLKCPSCKQKTLEVMNFMLWD
ncbi:hypothetical protein ACTWQB_10015 [Piscibacillus sp. B03]|uniref:hypothetical protein n=1 Tax=Piscibacillus sp. B03 TaxID=3457430 RepID=UPI003FCE60F7